MGQAKGTLRLQAGEEVNYFSRTLNQSITVASADEIDLDDLDDVIEEVQLALAEANATIKAAGSNARANRHFLPPDEWGALQQRRCTLGALHQRLLRNRASRNRLDRQQRHKAEEDAKAALVPDLPHYFQQVVRNESCDVDYQRWVLQAEIRRSADLARTRQKAARFA